MLLDVTTAVRTADRDATAGDSRDTVDDEVGFVDVKTLVDCWGVFLPRGAGGTLLPWPPTTDPVEPPLSFSRCIAKFSPAIKGYMIDFQGM